MTAAAVWVHRIKSATVDYEEACAIADTRTSISRQSINDAMAKILPLELGFRLQQPDGTFGKVTHSYKIGLCFAGNVHLVADVYFAAVNIFSCIGVDDASPEEDWPDMGAVANVFGALVQKYTDQMAARPGYVYRGSNFPSSNIVLFGQVGSLPPELWQITVRPEYGKAKISVRKEAGPLFLGSGARRLEKRWKTIVDEGFSPGGDTSLRALGALIGRLEDITVGGTTQISTCRAGEYTPYQTEPKFDGNSTYLGIRLSDFDAHLGGMVSGCIAMDTVVARGLQEQ